MCTLGASRILLHLKNPLLFKRKDTLLFYGAASLIHTLKAKEIEAKMESIKNYQESCVFCKILKKEEPGVNIYEDDYVACIKDIDPASTHHYLIIPKNHIVNAKVLKKEDEGLYDKMVDTVDTIIDKLGLEKNSTRTGFHWPPFTTVNHLHLHVISPVENMSFKKNMMFKPNSFWFVSTDYVKSRFEHLS